MIVGIGVDIVENIRFDSWIQDRKKIERFFNSEELSVNEISTEFLASRFAAKEALVKAFGTGFRGLNLKEIALVHDELGKPFFKLTGKAHEKWSLLQKPAINVSISHEKNYSIAFVVLEL
ncbi:MAG: holo-[acyl-carrier-protein] synthase [Spirochaetaceae bacterium]|nr:holo-[acyl-carrier-protein] synthase [Spirochaetaceae bacterium]